ncbi:hypothetical protein BpHYR1_038651 [Brachionus plicatilis]|uniref:Uncharacterized protein n=1 Tax=Brachionus plicatilis TaxID=10195 RepID=A0A3M7RKD9_BRAPC|nr:hypothetical protein BpHYR1_038651 [Brachionus plicatilis]
MNAPTSPPLKLAMITSSFLDKTKWNIKRFEQCGSSIKHFFSKNFLLSTIQYSGNSALCCSTSLSSCGKSSSIVDASARILFLANSAAKSVFSLWIAFSISVTKLSWLSNGSSINLSLSSNLRVI